MKYLYHYFMMFLESLTGEYEVFLKDNRLLVKRFPGFQHLWYWFSKDGSQVQCWIDDGDKKLYEVVNYPQFKAMYDIAKKIKGVEEMKEEDIVTQLHRINFRIEKLEKLEGVPEFLQEEAKHKLELLKKEKDILQTKVAINMVREI